jgi:hypothetical protein
MHPKLLESTIAQCRAYTEAGDCHGEAPPTERLIDAVVQLANTTVSVEDYRSLVARCIDIGERLVAKTKASDSAFLATRLRRLFAHFGIPTPDAGDDARLIDCAGAAIGMILTRLETAEPVAWVNGYELHDKANATIACGAERREVEGWSYDTPLYDHPSSVAPSDDEVRAVWNRTQDPIATVRAFIGSAGRSGAQAPKSKLYEKDQALEECTRAAAKGKK